MIKENLKEFEISNIPVWHKKGYTGKGVKVAEIERCYADAPFFDDKVKDPLNNGHEKRNSHGTKVLDVIHQIAPDTELYTLPRGCKIRNGELDKDSKIVKSFEFAVKEGIHIIGASLAGTDTEDLNKLILSCQEKGITFITSAGNEGRDGLTGYARSNVWIGVGAVGYSDSMEKIYKKRYSSTGKELDIVSFSGLYVHNVEKEDKIMKVEGTSFSSPFAIGMLALVQQFFLEKVGRPLYQDEIELFLKDHVIDLGEEGFDEYYGHGLFVLPDPDDIDPYKYSLRGETMAKVKDIQGHWAEKEIKDLIQEGILKGYEDGTFKPDQPITRAEIARVIHNVLSKYVWFK